MSGMNLSDVDFNNIEQWLREQGMETTSQQMLYMVTGLVGRVVEQNTKMVLGVIGLVEKLMEEDS